MGRDGTDAGGNSNAGRPGRGGRPDGYVFFNFFLPALLFSSSHSSSFPINSFAVEYNNSRGGSGRDVTDAGNVGRAGGVTGTSSVIFLFFYLFSPLFFFPLFFFSD